MWYYLRCEQPVPSLIVVSITSLIPSVGFVIEQVPCTIGNAGVKALGPMTDSRIVVEDHVSEIDVSTRLQAIDTPTAYIDQDDSRFDVSAHNASDQITHDAGIPVVSGYHVHEAQILRHKVAVLDDCVILMQELLDHWCVEVFQAEVASCRDIVGADQH